MANREDEPTQVRLTEFLMENFMGVKVVAFQPKGRMTVITGANGQGKTSAVSGISYVLGGAEWSPAVPTRRGAKKHLVKLGFKGDKGSFYFFRTQSGGLQFEAAPGCTAWATPQAMVGTMFNELALDPLGFVRQKPKDQVVTLQKYLGLTDTLAALEQTKKEAYDARRIVNREIEDLAAQIKNIVVQEGLPKDKIDEAEIRARLDAAHAENRRLAEKIEERARLSALLHDTEEAETKNSSFIETTMGKLEKLVAEYEHLDPLAPLAASVRDEMDAASDNARRLPSAAILDTAIQSARREAIAYLAWLGSRQVELRTQIDQARLALQAAERDSVRLGTAVADAMAALEAAPAVEPIDTPAIVEEWQNAQLKNREIDKRTYREAIEEKLKERQQESHRLNRVQQDCDDQKRAAVANAPMPLEGMSYDEGQVYFESIPLQQLGEGKQLEIAIALVLSAKPKLRLIRIPHGEALDEKGMEHLAELAEQWDFYVWMARVDSSGKVGVYLEDGEVKAINEDVTPPSDDSKAKSKRKEKSA